VILAVVGYSLNKPAQEGVTGQVTLAEAGPGQVVPTVRFSPPEAAEGAEFINVTGWQGGGLVVQPLEPTGEPGTYSTGVPVPADGSWKTIVRISRGNTLSAMPIFLPSDPAIPAKRVPAAERFERPFVADHEILQREQKDVAGGLTIAAYLVVASIALALLVLIAWALHRLAIVGDAGRRAPREDEREAPSPPVSGARAAGVSA
jgi:hypothetical protein